LRKKRRKKARQAPRLPLRETDPSLWFAGTVVIAAAGNPTPKNFGFADDTEETTPMADYIETYIIPGAQGLLNGHLGTSYTTSDVPEAVKLVALQVATRGLMNIAINKKGGLVNINQWMVALADETIFTTELKAQVESFKILGDRTGSVIASQYKTAPIKRRWGEEIAEDDYYAYS